MELVIAAGITGLGIYFNKDGKKQRDSNISLNSGESWGASPPDPSNLTGGQAPRPPEGSQGSWG